MKVPLMCLFVSLAVANASFFGLGNILGNHKGHGSHGNHDHYGHHDHHYQSSVGPTKVFEVKIISEISSGGYSNANGFGSADAAEPLQVIKLIHHNHAAGPAEGGFQQGSTEPEVFNVFHQQASHPSSASGGNPSQVIKLIHHHAASGSSAVGNAFGSAQSATPISALHPTPDEVIRVIHGKSSSNGGIVAHQTPSKVIRLIHEQSSSAGISSDLNAAYAPVQNVVQAPLVSLPGAQYLPPVQQHQSSGPISAPAPFYLPPSSSSYQQPIQPVSAPVYSLSASAPIPLPVHSSIYRAPALAHQPTAGYLPPAQL